MHSISFQTTLLRPFEDPDAPAFARAARESSGSVGPWLPWCHADYTEQEALDWFARCRSGELSGRAFEFGIFSTVDSELLGGAGLNEINPQHAICNLGYWVRQSRQRQGIASGSARALAQFGFDSLQLQRIEIIAALGNEASAAVARSAGARLECVARNRLRIGGVAVAAAVFSLVPDQFGCPAAAPAGRSQ